MTFFGCGYAVTQGADEWAVYMTLIGGVIVGFGFENIIGEGL